MEDDEEPGKTAQQRPDTTMSNTGVERRGQRKPRWIECKLNVQKTDSGNGPVLGEPFDDAGVQDASVIVCERQRRKRRNAEGEQRSGYDTVSHNAVASVRTVRDLAATPAITVATAAAARGVIGIANDIASRTLARTRIPSHTARTNRSPIRLNTVRPSKRPSTAVPASHATDTTISQLQTRNATSVSSSVTMSAS